MKSSQVSESIQSPEQNPAIFNPPPNHFTNSIIHFVIVNNSMVILHTCLWLEDINKYIDANTIVSLHGGL